MHSNMFSYGLLLVLVASSQGTPFFPLPPALASLFAPGLNLLQAVVVPGTGAVAGGGGAISAGGGAIALPGTAGGAAAVAPAVTAMMPAMMGSIFPALGLGLIKGILISQLLKPPQKQKKPKSYGHHQPSYGYQEQSYGYDHGHHARQSDFGNYY